MRTILEISAVGLLLCGTFLIAVHEHASPAETVALASPPAARSESVSATDRDSLRGIVSTRLADGSGTLTLPDEQPGYLIITSASADSPQATIEIAKSHLLRTDSVQWRPLDPLAITPPGKFSPRQTRSVTPDSETPGTDENQESAAARRRFFLHVKDGPLHDPRQYVPVHAALIAEGQRVRVFLDRQRQQTPQIERAAEQIIETLEKQILPRAAREVGPWADVDGDGKLSVLLTPWLERLQGGKTSLKGFVRGSDFRPFYPAPFSNQSDVIYFNSELTGDVNYLTLLAHEYWHVLQCSYRLSIPEMALPTEADWICEGTAHMAELRFGGGSENLTHRIDAWLSAPESARLIVENYYTAGLWRHDGCRGATFLFFHWLEQQCGPDLAQRLLTSPESGARNLELVTGIDLETLQIHWTVAMLEHSRVSEPSPQVARQEGLFAHAPAFRHVALSRLQIHSIESGSEVSNSLKLKLAPSATCYVRIAEGRWRLKSEPDIPLCVTFVPDDSTLQFVDSTRATDSERR